MKSWLAHAALFLLSSVAALDAHALDHVTSWNVVPAGATSRLDINGGSTNSCIPTGMNISVARMAIAVVLVPSTSSGCFSAGRPWTLSAMLPTLAPGPYAVTVTIPDQPGTLAQFNIVVPAGTPGSQQIPLGGPMLLGVLSSLLLLVAAVRMRQPA